MNAAQKFPEDWHPADIKAAIEKSGASLYALARAMGYAERSGSDVLRRAWSQMERAVADQIGVEPWVIWPSRYLQGRITRTSRRGKRPGTKPRIVTLPSDITPRRNRR